MTLKKRLLEFTQTPAAHQTVAQFNSTNDSTVGMDEENDPPSFIRNKMLERELEEKRLSQLKPNLSHLNPNLSQLNPNLSQLNPNLSQP